MKKRGKLAQANILTSVLIILIILVSIVVVWNVVYFLVNSSSSKISADAFTTNVYISATKLYLTGGSQISVRRDSGSGSITGLTFIFQKKNGETKTLTRNTNLPKELETKTYDFSSSELPFNNTDIAKISVVPVFGNNIGIQVEEISFSKDNSGNRILDINSSSGLVSWWKFDENLQDSLGTSSGQFYPNIIDDFEDGDYNSWQGSCTVPTLSIGSGYQSPYSLKMTPGAGTGCVYKTIDVIAGQEISFACKGYGCSVCVHNSTACINSGDGATSHGYVPDWTIYKTKITSSRTGAIIHLYNEVGGSTYYDLISYSPNFTTGKNNQAYNFNGINSYVNLGNTHPIKNSDNYTISVWTNISVVPPSINEILVYYGNFIIRYVSDKKYYFYACRGCTDSSCSLLPVVFSTKTYEVKEWHNLVVTFDKNAGTNQMKVYVDGVLDGSSTIPTTTSNNLVTESMYIGSWRGLQGNGVLMNGSIDNIMIFNRSLSSEEVQALYNNQK